MYPNAYTAYVAARVAAPEEPTATEVEAEQQLSAATDTQGEWEAEPAVTDDQQARAARVQAEQDADLDAQRSAEYENEL